MADVEKSYITGLVLASVGAGLYDIRAGLLLFGVGLMVPHLAGLLVLIRRG